MLARRAFCTLLILMVTSWVIAADDGVPNEPFPRIPPAGPVYTGPGHRGVAVSPDQRGRIVTAGGEFEAMNVTLLSWLTGPELGAGGAGICDCWGYVSPSGQEYAIVTTEINTSFVRITDPLNPVVVGTVSDASSGWSDVKVFGHYAYNVNEANANGIQVISLENIDSDVLGPVNEVHANGINKAHNIVINTDSGYAYAVGSNINGGGLAAYDLNADPANPPYAGGWSERNVHDAQVVSYTEGPWADKEIAFCFCGGAGLYIVDVTDKDAMTTISSTGYPSIGYCHQGWTEDKQYLYVDDELDELNGLVPTTRTMIFDIGDLANPELVNTITTGLTTIDHNLYVTDSVIYESNYSSGLQVFLAEDPEAPVLAAYFDTHPENNSINFSGSWSNYPMLPSGVVLVSDRQRGLFVLDVNIDAMSFSFPKGWQSFVLPDEPATVTVQIETIGADVAPESVNMFWRLDDGPWTLENMTDVGGGLFEASLPPAKCFGVFSFFFIAQNTAGGNFIDPTGAPSNVYELDVYSFADVALFDDLETDQGWTVGDVDDTATSGIWVRVDPVGTQAQPADDHTPEPGVMCCVTGQGKNGGAAADDDVDGGKTTLFSPLLSISNPDTRISFWRWYSNNYSGAVDDTFVIDLSNDNGANWTNVRTIGPEGPGTSGDWIYDEFTVSDYLTVSSEMKMRFVASDMWGASIVEAAIDDFRVFVPVCGDAGCVDASTCDDDLFCTTDVCDAGTCVNEPLVYGDVDGSTVVDLDDILCVVAGFANMDNCPMADIGNCEASGFIDMDDILAVLVAFGGGDPCCQ